MSDDLITTSEAASILDITVQAVGGLLRRGTIEGQKLGRDWVVSKNSVLSYKAQKEAKEKEQEKKSGGAQTYAHS
jgi:excisionase family DNA binding protein